MFDAKEQSVIANNYTVSALKMFVRGKILQCTKRAYNKTRIGQLSLLFSLLVLLLDYSPGVQRSPRTKRSVRFKLLSISNATGSLDQNGTTKKIKTKKYFHMIENGKNR